MRESGLTIHRGELLAIVGPSGSGKRSLLHQGRVEILSHPGVGVRAIFRLPMQVSS